MTKQQIISQTNAVLAEHFEIRPEDIHPDDIIRHTLQLNSLSALEVIVTIKRQYGIAITPRELSGLVTFEDLYDYMSVKLQAQ